jgi:hypothetical protein
LRSENPRDAVALGARARYHKLALGFDAVQTFGESYGPSRSALMFGVGFEGRPGIYIAAASAVAVGIVALGYVIFLSQAHFN